MKRRYGRAEFIGGSSLSHYQGHVFDALRHHGIAARDAMKLADSSAVLHAFSGGLSPEIAARNAVRAANANMRGTANRSGPRKPRKPRKTSKNFQKPCGCQTR